MMLLWVGLICVSVSWLYILPIFTLSTNFYFFWLICGLIINVLALRNYSYRVFSVDADESVVTFRKRCLKFALFVIPPILFSAIVPFPYNLGGLLLLVGLVLSFFSDRNPKGKLANPVETRNTEHASRITHYLFINISSIGAGFLLTGLIFIIQSTSVPFYYAFAARYHRIDLLNQIVYPLIKIFGLKASLSNGVIYLSTYEGALAFPAMWEKLGLHFLLIFFVGGAVLLLLFCRQRLRKILGLMGICFGYALLRYLILIFVFAQVNRAAIFWHPMLLTISFVPLPFILFAFYPQSARDSRSTKNDHFASEQFRFRSIDSLAALLVFIGIFSLMGVWGFHDPGVRKSGKILIDEKHSDWEWTTKKMDTQWYGSQSTYNYYNLAEYLDYFYHVDRNIDQELTRELLSDYDILMLKTPTESYDEQELENIVEFVRQGGGVWLIGDHTNVFGVNYYLNPVAKRFGLHFRYDSTYDLKHGTLTLYRRPKIFPHPIVQNMPKFLFATSCTLKASPLAENAMIGYGLRSRMLAYSGRGFFADEPTQDYEFGLFLQSAAVKYGKGRVAAFTDSTCFSNFYMFIPGKPEFALGSVEWLNRKNRYSFLSPIFAFIAIFALAAAIYIGRKAQTSNIWGIMFLSTLSAAALGLMSFEAMTEATYRLPTAHTDFQKVCFESEHSNIALPILKLVDNEPNNYHTFFVWTQRLGYVPSFEQTLESALMTGDLVVLVNPNKPFTDREIQQVVEYVEHGGSFLILDGPQNKKSTSNKLLEPFQMKIRFSKIKQSVIYNNRYEVVGPAKESGRVSGGETILMTVPSGEEPSPKNSVFSIAKRGKGMMAVMADSYIFTNAQMGTTRVVPNEERQQIYDLEFFVIEQLMEPRKN